MDALGALHPRPTVPADMDRAILAEARAGFLRRRRFWRVARAVGATAAAAAAITIAVVAVRERHQRAPAPVAAVAVPGDIDRNARVDILDAFLLARRVRDGVTTPADDLTADGVVDQRDVDRVAAMAVSVGDAGAKGG